MQPVTDLTEAAEHITATEDLARRVDVRGDDEVGRMAARFNTMLDTLEGSRAALDDSVEAQRRLVADASHELRTPVTSLRTNVEVLLAGHDLPESARRRLLEDVREQTEELSALITDVIELARGEVPVSGVEDVRLDDLVRDSVARVERHHPGTEFRCTFEPSVVEGLPDRLGRAVGNLLDNAAKYGPAGGVVEVEVAGGEVTVRDFGPGVPAAEAPFVFDRFYRERGRVGAVARGWGSRSCGRWPRRTGARWRSRGRCSRCGCRRCLRRVPTNLNSALRGSPRGVWSLENTGCAVFVAIVPTNSAHPAEIPHSAGTTPSVTCRSDVRPAPAANARSVRRRARPVPRPCLVARQPAPVPQHVVDRRRRRVAVRGHEQLDGMQRAGPDLDLLRRAVLEQQALLDPPDQALVELEHAVEPQHVRHEVVGEQGQPVHVVRGRDAREVEVRRRDLGALEERDALAFVARDVVPRRPPRERLGEPLGRALRRAHEAEEAPKYSTVTRSPSSRSARVRSAISSCAGSWPKVAATSGVSIAISSAEVQGPRARRPASTVRKPDIPAGLRRVGNQPEPKLIALRVSEKAARCSRVAPSRSGAGGDSAGSVRA